MNTTGTKTSVEVMLDYLDTHIEAMTQVASLLRDETDQSTPEGMKARTILGTMRRLSDDLSGK